LLIYIRYNQIEKLEFNKEDKENGNINKNPKIKDIGELNKIIWINKSFNP